MAIVEGDISRPTLGLDSADALDLASNLDVIMHCAGVTGFDLPQSLYDTVNVSGAANIADFALAAGVRAPGLVHVSTAYVCGDRSGAISETPVSSATKFTNSYEASKADAELMIAQRQRRGLKAAIARPSIIVGDVSTGAIRRFDHFYGLLKLVAEGRISVLPAAPGATLDLVPIDHVVGGLVDIAERLEAANGMVFHLAAGEPTPLTALEGLGIDYPDLQPARFVDPETFDLIALPPSQQRVFQRAAVAYADYLRRDPRFATDNLKALSGRACPPLRPAFLRRLVDYAISVGHVRRPGLTARRDSSAPVAS